VGCSAMVSWLLPVWGWFLLFFFSSRRRHTRLVSDWSSDVCSSDLTCPWGPPDLRAATAGSAGDGRVSRRRRGRAAATRSAGGDEIGRASCRERGEGWVGGGAVKKRMGGGGGGRRGGKERCVAW